MDALRTTVFCFLLLSGCVGPSTVYRPAATTGSNASTANAQALPPASHLQHITSGMVGCAPHEVGIADEQQLFGGRTWRAGCRGQAFFCTAGGQFGSCTAARGSAQAEAQGCSYDTQCKGERVCESGRCVEPRGASPANQGPATVESAEGVL